MNRRGFVTALLAAIGLRQVELFHPIVEVNSVDVAGCYLEFISMRQISREEIAKAFAVPLHLVGPIELNVRSHAERRKPHARATL